MHGTRRLNMAERFHTPRGPRNTGHMGRHYLGCRNSECRLLHSRRDGVRGKDADRHLNHKVCACKAQIIGLTAERVRRLLPCRLAGDISQASCRTEGSFLVFFLQTWDTLCPSESTWKQKQLSQLDTKETSHHRINVALNYRHIRCMYLSLPFLNTLVQLRIVCSENGKLRQPF